MEYRLKIDDTIIPVEVEKADTDTMTLFFDGKARDVQYSRISDHQIHLMIDGVGIQAFITGDSDEKTVILRGVPYEVSNADLSEQRGKGKRGPAAIPQEVTPPMPSIVVRILVAEGDRVKTGDAVIVVTAMKMESTLSAPFDGRVTKINVVEGDKVMPGEILADIEKDEESPTEEDDGLADS
jgi:biotin carboxyl carrier protein